ncbi:dipicolinate synthase subunit A [Seinonella peptonophila]|uniref:Dipicolinate synthase subunit A n=1 Tax=Seinonella peptonophila TaxID=112248 RepID=A0A1M5AQH5_9BACL|nr:dipicolinate synthase subunit DpsA [Seinonella peptonophila]SHF32493.1 dipicolinate synthase subunit A [Seinonella peptonophila]
MLTGKHVVFLGGDARQLEVIKRFIELDAQVSLVGFDNLQTPLSGTMQREWNTTVLEKADILILPIVGTDDQGNVASVFCSDNLTLTRKHMQALPKGSLIFTGMARPYLTQLCAEFDIHLFELLDRNDVAIYNSIPTVEGALMMAIQHTDITLHHANCVVLGLGRVGLSLARVLHAIGAKVSVGVRCPDDIARVFEMGLIPFQIKQLEQHVSHADIIFNTVPALVVQTSAINKMQHDVLIMDLATKPGGVDFKAAEKRGIKALLCPSLPGIVAPKTAGKILAQAITTLIDEVMIKEGLEA